MKKEVLLPGILISFLFPWCPSRFFRFPLPVHWHHTPLELFRPFHLSYIPYHIENVYEIPSFESPVITICCHGAFHSLFRIAAACFPYVMHKLFKHPTDSTLFIPHKIIIHRRFRRQLPFTDSSGEFSLKEGFRINADCGTAFNNLLCRRKIRRTAQHSNIFRKGSEIFLHHCIFYRYYQLLIFQIFQTDRPVFSGKQTRFRRKGNDRSFPTENPSRKEGIFLSVEMTPKSQDASSSRLTISSESPVVSL